MKRLDQRLVELGLAPSRSKAQQLIKAGEVEIRRDGEWTSNLQASQDSGFLSAEDFRLISGGQVLKFVSRGGLKLEAALKHLNLDVAGFRVLDIGLSTGGFTDCLLQYGAAEVAGIDVGRDQLHERLKNDPRLRAWEGLHFQNMSQIPELMQWLREGLRLCVVDVSFISLETLWPILHEVLPPEAAILALVKPQFEVGPKNLNRRGVVVDESLFDDVKSRVLRALEKYDFSIQDYFPCAVKGQDGNQEFFAYIRRL